MTESERERGSKCWYFRVRAAQASESLESETHTHVRGLPKLDFICVFNAPSERGWQPVKAGVKSDVKAFSLFLSSRETSRKEGERQREKKNEETT